MEDIYQYIELLILMLKSGLTTVDLTLKAVENVPRGTGGTFLYPGRNIWYRKNNTLKAGNIAAKLI